MRAAVVTAACLALLAAAPPASAGSGDEAPSGSTLDRIEELEQELDSLTEDVEDLQEPVDEFELFEQCAYLIGVTEYGTGESGYRFDGPRAARRPKPSGVVLRPALALDIRGFDRADFQFLAFPAEEPPSIECNEDAGEEEGDD